MSASRLFLQKFYHEALAKNPRYSVRAFAKKLEMYPSALNEILKGERSLSKSRAEKIAKCLNLSFKERKELLADFINPSEMLELLDEFHLRLSQEAYPELIERIKTIEIPTHREGYLLVRLLILNKD